MDILTLCEHWFQSPTTLPGGFCWSVTTQCVFKLHWFLSSGTWTDGSLNLTIDLNLWINENVEISEIDNYVISIADSFQKESIPRKLYDDKALPGLSSAYARVYTEQEEVTEEAVLNNRSNGQSCAKGRISWSGTEIDQTITEFKTSYRIDALGRIKVKKKKFGKVKSAAELLNKSAVGDVLDENNLPLLEDEAKAKRANLR